MILSNDLQLSQSGTTTSHTQSLGPKPSQRSFANENKKTGSFGLPPLLVIRATSPYQAKETTQLSFEIGDFFHVTDVLTDANGCTWFQVENPTKSLMQGVVPATHFQQYGPTRPAKLVPIRKQPNAPHTKSQSRKLFPKAKVSPASTLAIPSHSPNPTTSQSFQEPRPRTLNLGYRSLFGIVRYPFLAERPDELTAQCGEPVIIVAHSAQEWFVVKPICRLGAPGLIPASYIEIQEIQTCRVLSPEQVTNLMQTSAIPTVDEWKKIVSDHRARCISLGVISNEDDSMNSQKADVESTLLPHAKENHLIFPGDQNLLLTDWRQRQAAFIQSAQQDSGLPCVEEEDESDVDPNDQIRKDCEVLGQAHIISFHYEQGQFWYQVQAHFRSSKSAPRAPRLLYRLDAHFRKLESDLQKRFTAANCMLPQLPSSATPTDEIACARRMEQLRSYLEQICALPEYMRRSDAIWQFFSTRPGDIDVDGFDEEVEAPLEESNLKLSPPIIQIPLEDDESYANTGTLDRSFRNFEKTGESYLSHDVRSWITSWQATTADECRFSNGAPSPSTRPSSINSRTPSPTIENKELPGSSLKPCSRHSVWLPDFNQAYNEEFILPAE